MDYVWRWVEGIGWCRERTPEAMKERMERMTFACLKCGYVFKKGENGACPECGGLIPFLKSFKGGEN